MDAAGPDLPGSRGRRRTVTTALLAAFALLLVGELAALAAGGPDGLVLVADLLLMPLLVAALAVAAGLRSRPAVASAVALLLSWAGDNTGAIPLKLALFLPAVLAYVVAFWPFRRAGLLVRALPLTGLGLALAALIVLTAVHAGPLAVPVAAYGVALGLLVATAWGVHPLAAAGAVLFLLSDVVLALDVFVLPGGLPAADLLNSVLYLPGQALLVLGVLRRAGGPLPPR